MNNAVTIKNKKVNFEYHLEERYIAGIMLTGTEIKSIRMGKANLNDAYCYFNEHELFIKNLHISEYDKGTHYNHNPKRDRKLLLKLRELTKLKTKVKERGYTIVPVRLFTNDKGLAKLEIALARGKKEFDKREDIKKRDTQREVKKYL